MFQSTTIIRELAFEPGLSYTYVKTIGKISENFNIPRKPTYELAPLGASCRFFQPTVSQLAAL
jgi:hypothetical protein